MQELVQSAGLSQQRVPVQPFEMFLAPAGHNLVPQRSQAVSFSSCGFLAPQRSAVAYPILMDVRVPRSASNSFLGRHLWLFRDRVQRI